MRSLPFLGLALSANATLAQVPPPQLSWSIDGIPTVIIGATSTSGEVLFEHPIAATRLSNGAIVVGDDHGRAVLLFDAAGRVLKRIGRNGSGPGEFRHIWWLGQCAPDSVFVWDFVLRRMTVINASGGVIRQYPVPSDGRASSAPITVACSRAGLFVYQPLPPMGTPRTSELPTFRGEAMVSLGDSRGNITRAVGEVAGGEMIVLGGGGSPRPLGKRTSLAVSATRLYVGTADSGFVDVFGLEGGRQSAIPLGVNSRNPTPANYARAVDDLVGSIHGTIRDTIRQRMLGMPMPERLPPYSTILTDTENVLWIVLSAPGDKDTELRAVNEAGRVLADLRIPVSLTVFEIGHDYILGAAEDPDGQPYVAAFHLRRSD